MSILERLPIPRHLSSRVWLITLPSALVSFERRQGVPKLPIGRLRFLGVPVIAGGIALSFAAWRRVESPVQSDGPLAKLAAQPATLGGVLVLGGIGLLLRSSVLAVYSLGVALAASSETIAVQEPRPSDLLGGNGH